MNACRVSRRANEVCFKTFRKYLSDSLKRVWRSFFDSSVPFWLIMITEWIARIYIYEWAIFVLRAVKPHCCHHDALYLLYSSTSEALAILWKCYVLMSNKSAILVDTTKAWIHHVIQPVQPALFSFGSQSSIFSGSASWWPNSSSRATPGCFVRSWM